MVRTDPTHAAARSRQMASPSDELGSSGVLVCQHARGGVGAEVFLRRAQRAMTGWCVGEAAGRSRASTALRKTVGAQARSAEHLRVSCELEHQERVRIPPSPPPFPVRYRRDGGSACQALPAECPGCAGTPGFSKLMASRSTLEAKCM